MAQEGTTEKALARFASYLKRNHLKMTRERRLILREMLEDDSHLEAEDLLVRFRQRGEKVSRATIYRTFDLLVRAGLIEKSDFGHGHYHYEKSFGREHHAHMICQQCGAVIEFGSVELENLQKRICAEHGFRPEKHSLQIFGTCSKCAGG